jgi:UDP-N-acetylmuramoyl-tripeptide--D-alanyl-D-alanine ligase
VTIIDDTYNANPDSVRAAIDLLVQRPSPRVLILGDMGEVGADGPEFHREVGGYARTRGVDILLGLGELCSEAIAAFNADRPASGRHFESIEALIEAARAASVSEATLLAKGSRFMRMERVVKALLNPD